jgi:hypothetical protein
MTRLRPTLDQILNDLHNSLQAAVMTAEHLSRVSTQQAHEARAAAAAMARAVTAAHDLRSFMLAHHDEKGGA